MELRHLRYIRFRQKACPADGDHLSQHCAASWRADDDDALRDLPGVALVGSAKPCGDVRRVRRSVWPALLSARTAVPRHITAAMVGSRPRRKPICPRTANTARDT